MSVLRYEYNPADFLPSAPSPPPPQAVTPAVVNPDLLKIQVPENFLKDRVCELNLEKFRSASLPAFYYLLLLLPLIGWLMLAIFQTDNNRCLHDANAALQQKQIPEEDRLKNAVRLSGPLENQYRLELARYYLLQNRFSDALKELDQIPHANKVARVWHTHSTLVAREEHIVLHRDSAQKNIFFSGNLVTFVPPQDGPIYTDHETMMPLRTDHFEQAFMTTLALAGVASSQPPGGSYYQKAYVAWNEAYYYLAENENRDDPTPINQNYNFSKYRFALAQLMKSAGFMFMLNGQNITQRIITLEEDYGLPQDLQGKEITLEHNFWPLNVAASQVNGAANSHATTP